MVKIKDLSIGFDGLCDDPYQSGCKEEAIYYRERIWKDKPDEPQYLCQDCYDCLVESYDGFNPDEWEMIEE